MEKQTILCTALPNGRNGDGSLRLSVYVSPRLWSDDLGTGKLALSQFPDWLSWPTLIGTANWSVTFAGQPPINATVESAAPRLDLWQALFKPETDVVPFRFEDFRDAVIETIDSALIHDTLAGLYARAATDPAYGAGLHLPKVEVLAGDPAFQAIARGSEEEIPPEPGPRPAPIDVGGKPPRPEPDPGPGSEPGPTRPPTESTRCCQGCGCGCLFLPFTLLGRLFPRFGRWLDTLFGFDPDTCLPDSADPVEALQPTSWPLETAGIPPNSPSVVAPDPPPQAPRITPGGPPSAKKAVFDAVTAFVTSPSDVSGKLPTPAELEEIYDFHRMVATLGDYPKMLRLLGLVIDLRVEVAAVAPAPSGTVKVEPTLAFAMASTVASPRTNYTLGGAQFLARPRPVSPEISNGLLRLDDAAQFRVIQVDVVGGGTKLQNAATNTAAFAKPEDRAPNMPENEGLPALRTGGISVVRRDIASELRQGFDRSLALQLSVSALDGSPGSPAGAAPPPPATDELFAEDLVRGYRVDVFDNRSNAWHSLCQRVGTYEFLEAPAAPGGKLSLVESDEGFVQFGATEPLAPVAKPVLKTGDSLFVWDGWSLCAPRPGKVIMPEFNPDGSAILADPPNEAETKFKLVANFKAAKGTLPRLRFEYKYRLRARVCDLAGNSVFGPGDAEFAADPAEQTPLFDCARYEPVSPPAMVLQALPVEGESLERLVVRSPAVAGEAQSTERHIVPPKASQLMAEQHGKFDTPSIIDGSTTGYDRAKRESGAVTDVAVEVKKDIWVHAAPKLEVPWLPDPSSRGAVLLGLPGLAAEEIVEPTAVKTVNKVPFAGVWPDLQPFRLRLVAIAAGAVPAEPDWNEPERVLTVELPAAEQKTVRLNSFLTAPDFAQQGVAQWTKAEALADFPKAETDTVLGRSWLHLPWRELTLVHAVQQPLEIATIAALTPDKQIGKTFVTLTGDVGSHAASTGKVDIRAEWIDPIDDPAQPTLTTRRHNAHICEVMIPPGSATTALPNSAAQPKPVQEFGDTKFHEVNYTTVATTRFREYFPPSITSDPANISVPNPVPVTRPVLNSARPDAPRVLYIVPAYEWREIAQPPGKTKRVRRGGGLRVYFERPWYSSGAGELLGVVILPDVQFLDLTEKERTLVTHWGADPIWSSAASIDHARLKNFEGLAGKDEGLTLAEFDKPVSVAGYAVEFDPTRRLWFADIQMEIGAAYAPFVRLALVRYQPNSVKNAHLSRVVRADFVQLAADRTASVAVSPTAAGAKIGVVVKGPTYSGSSVTRTTETLPDLFGKESARKGLSEIEVLLQRRNRDFGSETDIGWDTMGTELLTQIPADPGAWEGTIELGEPLVPGAFRILLKEYEWFRSDFQSDAAAENVQLARRVVYADTVLLG